MSKAVYPLSPEARKGSLFFGDGWLFPNAPGQPVFAPISGSLDAIDWARKNEDGFVDAIAHIKGDDGITVRIETVTLPRPLPARIEAGDLLGVAGRAKDGGFWIRTFETKTRKNIDPKSFFATRLTTATGGNGAGAGILLLLLGGIFLLRKKKR